MSGHWIMTLGANAPHSRPSVACWFDFGPFSGYTIVVFDRAWILTLGHSVLAIRHSELR